MAKGTGPVNRTANIHINTASAERSLERLTKRSESLSKEIKKGQDAGEAMKDELADLARVNSKIEELKGIMSGELAPSIRLVKKRVSELHRELDSMSKDAPGYAAKFREFQDASKYLKQLKGDIQGVDRAMHTQVKSKSGTFFSNVKSIAAGVLIGNTVQAGIDKVMGYVNNLVSGNAALADSLADVEKNTGLSSVQVERLNKQLSALDTRSAKKQLLDIANTLGKLGQEVSVEAIQNIDRIVVALSDEFDGDAGSITEQLSVLRNNLIDFKSNNYAEDILHIGNALNVLGAEGLASAPVVTDISNRIAGVATTFGVTTDQILGTAATMQELGIKSERGSTAYIRILQNMTKNVKDYAEIAGYAGIKEKEFVDLVNTDIVAALMKVSEGTKIAGNNNIRFGNILDQLNADGSGAGEVLSKLAQNSELYAEKIKLAGDALKDTTSITDEFNKKNDNLAGTLSKIEKRIASWFTSSTIKTGVTYLVTLFGELIGAIDHTNTSLEEFNKQKDVVAELDRDIVPLLDRIDALKSKSSLTEIEQQELRKAIEDVGKAIPNTITEVDNYGNAMAISSEKAREFIRLQRLALGVKNADAIKDQQSDINDTIFEINRFKSFPDQRSKTGKSNEDYIRERYKDDPAKLAQALDNWNKQLTLARQRLNENRNKLEGQLVLLAQISGKSYEQVLQENEKYQLALGKMVIPAPAGYNTTTDATGDTKPLKPTGGAGLSAEDRKKIEAEYKKRLQDQQKLAEELEKGWRMLAAKAQDSSDDLLLNHAEEAAKVVQKYEDLLKLTHNNVKLMAELNAQQEQELDLLYQKQFSERSDKEYDESLKTLHNFYLQKRQVVEQDYLNGTIDAQQYYDKIRKLDRDESEDRLTVVKDYVATSTKAAKDAENAKTAALAKGVQDRLRLEQKEANARIYEAERAVITSKLGTKQRLDAELSLITEKYRQEIALAKGNAEQVKLLEARRNNELAEANRQFINTKISQVQNYVSAISGVYSNFMNYLIEQGNSDLAREKAINDRKREDFDKMLSGKRIDEETHKQATEALDEAYREKEEKLRRKQFKREKAAAIGQVGIDTALAISGTYAQYGNTPMAWALIALTVAAMGMQIAAISSKKYQTLAKGGILDGPSHAQGGMSVLNGTGQKVMELEGKEAVLSKETVANNYDLVSALVNSSMNKNGASISTDWVGAATPSLNTAMLYKSMIASAAMKQNGGVSHSSAQPSSVNATTTNSSDQLGSFMQLVTEFKSFMEDLQKNGMYAKVFYKDIKEANDKYSELRKGSAFNKE